MFLKKVLFFVILLLCFAASKAQIIAQYPLITGGSNPVGGTSSIANANLTASPVVVGANLEAAPSGTYNSTGLRIKLGSGFNTWPDFNTNLYHIDVEISPKANFFFSLADISFTTTTNNSGEPLFAQAAYQTNGTGTWITLGATIGCNTVSINNITGLTSTFRFGNNYTFRLYFKGTSTTKSQHIRIKDLIFNGTITGLPIVHTTSIKAQASVGANYSANITGNFSTGVGIQTVNQSGFCWATSPTIPTLLNFNNTITGTNNAGTTSLNATISSLAVGTIYNARTYVITNTDTLFGETLSVKAQSNPIVTTNAISNILSNKAKSGGIVTDSGSLNILEKGVCWAVFPAIPTISNSKTNEGTSSSSFTSFIKNLLPNTKYNVRAYATNNLNTSYGAVETFTSDAPVPTITLTPSVLDFGDITFSTSAPILSYKINANYLTPTGTISLTANAGYTICATLNGVYSSTLTLNYTGSTITNKIIYVKSFSTPYGTKNGMVLHTGGGTITPNADTTFLQTNIVQNQDTLTNKGTDFWCGFGYQNNMETAPTDSKAAHMSVYISTGNVAANVTIEMPGISGAAGFPQTWLIPANSVKEITGFPIGTTDEFNSGNDADSRLYYTGISKRGIHIVSNNGVPVSVCMDAHLHYQ